MAFWVVKACILFDENHRHEVIRCPHLEGWDRKTSDLKMEASCCCDTLVVSRNTTVLYNQEDRRVNKHCH
jgi:hypothetical protein